jgi:hypothetical protein
MRAIPKATATFLLTLLSAGLSGCDALGDLFGGDAEVTGDVSEIGADYLTVEATRYEVTPETEFEGFTGLSEISVGDTVGIEYDVRDGARVAIEIEDASLEDDD